MNVFSPSLVISSGLPVALAALSPVVERGASAGVNGERGSALLLVLVSAGGLLTSLGLAGGSLAGNPGAGGDECDGYWAQSPDTARHHNRRIKPDTFNSSLYVASGTGSANHKNRVINHADLHCFSMRYETFNIKI
jgi:hypothetical protein